MRRVSVLMALCLVGLLLAGGAVAQKDGTSGARLTPSRLFVPTVESGSVHCSTPGIAIPDDDAIGVNDSLSIAINGTIEDIDVSINTTHTWVGDLIYTLEHQDTGESVVFYDRPGEPASTFGCDGDDIDATIDDEAATAVEDECGAGVPSIQGSFIGGDPADASLMTAFDGENGFGTWVLTVSDNAGGDTGTLHEWCIILSGNPGGCNISTRVKTRRVRAGQMARFSFDLSHNRDRTVTVPVWIWIEDVAGNVITSGSTRPMTLSPGDQIKRNFRIRIPRGTAPGTYTLYTSVREMKQGEVEIGSAFTVVR